MNVLIAELMSPTTMARLLGAAFLMGGLVFFASSVISFFFIKDRENRIISSVTSLLLGVVCIFVSIMSFTTPEDEFPTDDEPTTSTTSPTAFLERNP